MTKTYTLAVGLSEDVVLACVLDSEDISKSITKEHFAAYDKIGIITGVILGNAGREDDNCVHSFLHKESSPLQDENGERFLYAIERDGFPTTQMLMRRKF